MERTKTCKKIWNYFSLLIINCYFNFDKKINCYFIWRINYIILTNHIKTSYFNQYFHRFNNYNFLFYFRPLFLLFSFFWTLYFLFYSKTKLYIFNQSYKNCLFYDVVSVVEGLEHGVSELHEYANLFAEVDELLRH